MLDTHVAVALYEGRLNGLSHAASRAIDREVALISPAVVLELELLHEIGRLKVGGTPISRYLREELDVEIAPDRFSDVVHEAISLSFTRDPFDRLIVAHAALLKAPLITRDDTIRRSYVRALS